MFLQAPNLLRHVLHLGREGGKEGPKVLLQCLATLISEALPPLVGLNLQEFPQNVRSQLHSELLWEHFPTLEGNHSVNVGWGIHFAVHMTCFIIYLTLYLLVFMNKGKKGFDEVTHVGILYLELAARESVFEPLCLYIMCIYKNTHTHTQYLIRSPMVPNKKH